MLQKSKLFYQLHLNQIYNHVILNLVIKQSFYSTAFGSVSLDRFMKRTLTYSKLQVPKHVVSLKEMTIYRTLRNNWIHGNTGK